MPHALLFFGPKNIGKTAVARWLAAKLLNTAEDKLENHPDFYALPDGATIGKEEIDAASERIKLSAFGGGYKAVIISDAHNMTGAAANAFLKTLEEPPKRSIIILTTSEYSRILPTIISRSVVFQFQPVAKDDVREFLRARGGVDLKNLINVSFGRPGRAIKLLESGDWQKPACAAMREFYSLFFAEPAERLRTSAGIFAAKKESGKDLILRRVDFWLELLRDIIFIKYNLNDAVAHSYDYATLERAAASRPVRIFSSLAARLLKMRELIKKNINAQLLLENLII